jgi:predicted lipoprotein
VKEHFIMRWAGCAAAVVVGLLLASCRLIATADIPTLSRAGDPNSGGAFDPDKMVASIWSTKVVPYFEKKAGPLKEVRELAAKSPDEAGAKSGYRAKSEDTPWTLLVRFDGVIVAADTESRASTIGVDATGQGKADAIVQIGPAMRGTAIRDALDFVSFGDFTNQIDFARYGKAFNTYVNQTTLEKLPRDSLVARKVSVLGAYPFVSADETPVVTPVEISIGPKQ